MSIIGSHAVIEIYPDGRLTNDKDSSAGLVSLDSGAGATSIIAPVSKTMSVYVPLIGDLDGSPYPAITSNRRSLSPSSNRKLQSDVLTSPAVSKSNNKSDHKTGNPRSASTPVHCNLFRRLLQNYSYPTKIQSWSEFLDTRRMRTPKCPNQITGRLFKNLQHFQGNYLCLFVILFIYCVLTSPFLLLAIGLVCCALYFVTVISHQSSSRQDVRPLNILGIEPTLQQQYTAITVISLPLLWVSGAPAALFWVLGASLFVIGLHSTIYAIEMDNIKDAGIERIPGYVQGGQAFESSVIEFSGQIQDI